MAGVKFEARKLRTCLYVPGCNFVPVWLLLFLVVDIGDVVVLVEVRDGGGVVLGCNC